MKKIILMVAVVSLMVNVGRAQSTMDFREQLHFGVKAGFNYSNVFDAKGEEFTADPKLGFAGGAFIAIPFGELLGFQPEILFSQKGFKGSGRLLGSTYNFTRTSNFIDIPLMFALKPSGMLTLLAGPQYSYLIKQKDVFSSGILSVEQEQEFNNENIHKNLFCFTGGLDITLSHFVVSARAGWDMVNNNGDGTSSTPRYKNVWYQGTIAYRIYSE